MYANPPSRRNVGSHSTSLFQPTSLETLEARTLLAVDLVAAFINSANHTLEPGEDFASAMVVNNDEDDHSGAFSVEMRLSLDNIFGNADDIVLGTAERPLGLDGNASTSIVRTFSIPGDAAAGDYYLAFRVDPLNEVVESNETNNTFFGATQQITITGAVGGVNLDVFGNSVEIGDGAHVPSLDNHTAFGDVDIGDVRDRMFMLMNNGSGTLQILGVTITGTNALDFVVVGNPVTSLGPGESATLTLRYTPTAEAISIANVNIETNDSDDGVGDPSVFTFAINGFGHTPGAPTNPEIEVRGNDLVINAGDMSPRAQDGTNFGRLRPENAALTRTFVIHNLGDQLLTISGIEITGRNAEDFVILDTITSIGAGESATLRIRFDPSALGKHIAQVRILSNDSDEGIYAFRVKGRGANNGGIGDAGAEIDVRGRDVSIANGDTSPSRADNTTFGRVGRNDATRNRPYFIFNTGTSTLEITSITIEGRDASDFTVLDFPTTIEPGESARLRVRFAPSALGARRAEVRIVSNDLTDSDFVFRIRGNGINNNPAQGGGEITVTGVLPIENGDTSPNAAEGTHFRRVNVNGGRNRTFTITNTGSGELSLVGPFVEITGRNPARFTIIQMPADTTLAAGESTTFVVRFNPTGARVSRATIQIHSNDGDEGVFSFDIAGRGRVA